MADSIVVVSFWWIQRNVAGLCLLSVGLCVLNYHTDRWYLGRFVNRRCLPKYRGNAHSVRGGSSQNGDVPGDTVSLKETQLQGQNKKRAEASYVVTNRVVL